MIPHYLLALDFDGTIAQTFKPNAKGVGVHEIHELVVEEIFGRQGLEAYENIGGLKNRAAAELMGLLLAQPGLLNLAQQSHADRAPHLEHIMPEGKGSTLVWNAHNPLQTVTELFVRMKLDHYIDHIKYDDLGVWPEQSNGFANFWKKLDNMNEDGRFHIDTAIVSSGHDLFIRKTFDTWGIHLPDIMVTDDDVRPREHPREMDRRIKPGQLPLALAHLEWLELLGVTPDTFDLQKVKQSKERILYAGDDINKDGQLSQRAGIPFVHFATQPTEGDHLTINDWGELGNALISSKESLRTGRPFKEILSPRSHNLESTMVGLQRRL